MWDISAELNAWAYKINWLGAVNVLMGRNGCGKSSAMRYLNKELPAVLPDCGKVFYVPPERSWWLKYESGIDNAVRSNETWRISQLDVNQAQNYKSQIFSIFSQLELTLLRRAERNGVVADFESRILPYINNLLSNVKLVNEANGFKIYSKANSSEIPPEKISSGESELLALAIECLHFWLIIAEPGKNNILLLDEPDVHLHPDLQANLTIFLNRLTTEYDLTVIIATHSTAVLGALQRNDTARVCFMGNWGYHLKFEPVSKYHERVLPIFGAHPLSSVFNSSPALILEGDDDVRIWQQVIRSSRGKVKIYPVAAGSVADITEMEQCAKHLISTVYDAGVGYSLRDGDGNPDATIPDDDPIIRFRLACYSSENLILSDETILKAWAGQWISSWEDLKRKMDSVILDESWKPPSVRSVHYDEFVEFQREGYPRRTRKIKGIRNALLYILGYHGSWEVLVWQTIAENLGNCRNSLSNVDWWIFRYLGEKITNFLDSFNPHTTPQALWEQ